MIDINDMWPPIEEPRNSISSRCGWWCEVNNRGTFLNKEYGRTRKQKCNKDDWQMT